MLTATATDNVGVTGVEFQVDGVQVFSTRQHRRPTPRRRHGRLRLRAACGPHPRPRCCRQLLAMGHRRRCSSAAAAPQPTGFTRNEDWITGLSSATAFAQAPDGRLFVAEQGGALRVVKNGSLLADAVHHAAGRPERRTRPDRRGPAPAASPATAASTSTTRARDRHAQPHQPLHRQSGQRDVALRPTARPRIADLPALSSATNHNGGAMHFGLDGKLYVAVGDNANSGQGAEPGRPLRQDAALQRRRQHPDRQPASTPHRASAHRAIWAYGLRNPFTFAVQPGTGRMHINDVGAGTWEEINLGAAGANYGWPATEGPTTARRCHRAAVRVQAQRHHAARFGRRRLLHRLRHHRRRVLPGHRQLPCGLPRQLLLRRLLQLGDRT